MTEGDNRPSLKEVRAAQAARLETVLADRSFTGHARIKQIVEVTRSGRVFDRNSVQKAQSIIELAGNGATVKPDELLDAGVTMALFSSLSDKWQDSINLGSIQVHMDMCGNTIFRPATHQQI